MELKFKVRIRRLESQQGKEKLLGEIVLDLIDDGGSALGATRGVFIPLTPNILRNAETEAKLRDLVKSQGEVELVLRCEEKKIGGELIGGKPWTWFGYTTEKPDKPDRPALEVSWENMNGYGKRAIRFGMDYREASFRKWDFIYENPRKLFQVHNIWDVGGEDSCAMCIRHDNGCGDCELYASMSGSCNSVGSLYQKARHAQDEEEFKFFSGKIRDRLKQIWEESK